MQWNFIYWRRNQIHEFKYECGITAKLLRPLQIIVRTGASLDFSSGNNRLYLAEGSSIIFSGGTMTGGICNASERIYIGTNLLSSCIGSNAVVSFADILTVGGSGNASSNSPVCVGNPINLSATPPPTGTYTYSWSGPGLLATPFISDPNYTLAASISNSGTYQVRMKTSLITNPMVGEITVTVNPLLTTPNISGLTQPSCTLTTGSVTLSNLPATGTWTLSRSGTSTATTAGTGSSTTITGLLPGTYNYSASVAGCPSPASASFTINAQPSTPSAPLIGATTQPDCITATGSIALSGLPISGTWNLYQNGNAVPIVTGGSGTTYTVVGLTAGNYTFKVGNGTCTSVASNGFQITIAPSATSWSGSWSNGLPTLSNEAIINANYDTLINGHIQACSLVISAGTLVIRDRKSVTIQNNLTVNTGAVLNIENQGSLIMVSDSGRVTNNGTIDVKKTTTPFELYDYTYWSTPIISTTIATIFPTWRTDYAFRFEPANFEDANGDGFDDNGNDWIRASLMSPGKGYVIMGPTSGSFNNRTESVVFTGKVNNGNVTTPIALTPSSVNAFDDFNLVGNPYPSAMSADDFINANLTNISGTLYFWTHKKNISVSNPGPDTYNYSQDDYAMYNLSGGIGTSAAYSGTASATPIPNGYIASCQGFFVEATNAAPLTFNNTMRVGLPDSANSQFFKTASNKKDNTDRDRIWLNLENADGMFSQQLVGYFKDATLDFDKGYDGLVNDGGNYISFYSFIDDDTYRIQGRGQFDIKDQVRLGYFSAVAGIFSIAIDTKEGLFTKEDFSVFLEDKLLDVIHDLKQEPYTFNTQKGNFNDRFILRYTNKNLGNNDFSTKENLVLVSNTNKHIRINSFAETIDKVSVYDIAGKQIFQKTNVNSNELSISNLVFRDQVLLVKTSLQNGQTVSNKIIY